MTRLALHVLIAAAVCAGGAWAKLPEPSDEAKAKAAEAAAKTAAGAKVAAYLLCKSQDQVAAAYHAQAKKAGTAAKPAIATPPCVDPSGAAAAPAKSAKK